MTADPHALTDEQAAAVLRESLDTGTPAPPPLNLSPEMIAACARQDIPVASIAELRAQIALIGERARRAAITAEYERLLAPASQPE